MKIVGFGASNYRSLGKINIRNCSGLNAFIGKNNAGKSNILSAITTFFLIVRNGVVNVEWEPDQPQYVHHKSSQNSPFIRLVFELDETEMNSLCEWLSTDVPQMNHAIEHLPNKGHQLLIEVSLDMKGQRLFGFVSRISVGRLDETKEIRLTNETVLFIADRKSGDAMFDRASRRLQIMKNIEDLTRIENTTHSEDYKAWKTPDAAPSYRRRPLRMLADAPGIAESVFQAFEESKTHSEFLSSVTDLKMENQVALSDLDNKNYDSPFSVFSGTQNHLPSYVIRLLEKIGKMNVLYLSDRREPIGATEAQALLKIKIQRRGTERFTSLQEAIKSLLGVSIDAYSDNDDNRIPRTQRDYYFGNQMKANMEIDDFLAEANGSGIREALRLILDIELNNPDTILIEEPEVHLHPGLETSMSNYLRDVSRRSQIFLTTHSPIFLNYPNVDSVYFVKRSNGNTSVDNIPSLDDANDALMIKRELGVPFSNLFMFESLLLVEGRSDEIVLRIFGSKLSCDFEKKGIGIFPIFGGRNVRNQGIQSLAKGLSNYGLAVSFLIDRDEKGNEEIEELVSRLSSAGASLFVLNNREIENYLLNSRVLAEFINEKLESQKANRTVSTHEVDAAISEIVNGMQDDVVFRHLKHLLLSPIYASQTPLDPIHSPERSVAETLNKMSNECQRRKEEISDDANSFREYLQEEYSTKWRSLVPGTEVIDAVAKKFGARYKKESADPRLLASFFKREEIDNELVRLISKITMTLSHT